MENGKLVENAEAAAAAAAVVAAAAEGDIDIALSVRQTELIERA